MVVIQSNDYHNEKLSPKRPPMAKVRTRPLTSMTHNTAKLSSGAGSTGPNSRPYGISLGGASSMAKPPTSCVSKSLATANLTEVQIKNTVANLQNMLSRLPSNSKNKNYI